VPDVVGWNLSAARVRLQAQPLTPQLVYKPAKAGQRIDVVLRQFPRTGRLSSFDKVTLVLGKPLHGTVPDVVGLKLTKARVRLRKLKLRPALRFAVGKPGRVVAQKPRAGVAAAPGMKIRITVGGAG
jgi:beta-lactam-binding protein with PASTA domain